MQRAAYLFLNARYGTVTGHGSRDKGQVSHEGHLVVRVTGDAAEGTKGLHSKVHAGIEGTECSFEQGGDSSHSR